MFPKDSEFVPWGTCPTWSHVNQISKLAVMNLESWYIFLVCSLLFAVFPAPVAASPAAGAAVCVIVFLCLGFFFTCVGLGMLKSTHIHEFRLNFYFIYYLSSLNLLFRLVRETARIYKFWVKLIRKKTKYNCTKF
jgi:hypothetical protein